MKHEFIKYNNRLCRVLQKEDNNCLLIYCDGVTMPFWMKADGLRELSAEEIIESKEIEIEQNRCAMACQGCGAVCYFF